MKFNWQEDEKEIFYQKAEKQLEEAEIDFIGVDRKSFGVRGWNEKEKTVQAVIVSLNPFSYKNLSSTQKRKLKELKNWECTDECRRGSEKQIFMHSRLIIMDMSETESKALV